MTDDFTLAFRLWKRYKCGPNGMIRTVTRGRRETKGKGRTMNATTKLRVEIRFEDEHRDQNCGCTIPAAWVAHFSNGQPKWPCDGHDSTWD
jgi:hypothetical protein